jgi:hypothetical protein
MGYIRHHAIVVTSWDLEKIRQALVVLNMIASKQAVGPFISPVNSYHTIMMIPDGGKERWPNSDNGDEARAKFVSWLKAHDHYYRWAEIQYGDEDSDNRMLRHDAMGQQTTERDVSAETDK